MQMDVGLDTGPMLSPASIRLTPDDTAGSVFEKLSTLGADLLIETLPDYLSGKSNTNSSTRRRRDLRTHDEKGRGPLDFTHTAEELERRVRAFNPWPGAFMDFDGTLLIINNNNYL
jgi:methionyl-tRNA formyltransferase